MTLPKEKFIFYLLQDRIFLKEFCILSENAIDLAHDNNMRRWLSELIVSNVKVIVQQQQQLFNLLWDKAILTKHRIKEIELGTKREFIDTMRDPNDIIKYLSKIKPVFYIYRWLIISIFPKVC